MAANDLHRVANARKAFTGQYQGLLDPAILAAKEGRRKTGSSQATQSDVATSREQADGPIGLAIEHRRRPEERWPAFEQRVLPARSAATRFDADCSRSPATWCGWRRAAEAEQRPAARVPRLEPGIAEVLSSSRRRRSTPSWSGSS